VLSVYVCSRTCHIAYRAKNYSDRSCIALIQISLKSSVAICDETYHLKAPVKQLLVCMPAHHAANVMAFPIVMSESREPGTWQVAEHGQGGKDHVCHQISFNEPCVPSIG
jgi:hypothetical protein